MKAQSFAVGALAASLFAIAQPAAAVVITSLPDGVKQEFTRSSAQITKPVTFGDGITYRTTTLTGVQSGSRFGYTGGFSFPDGSNWGGGEPFAAIGLTSAIMSFTFEDPVSAVLGEFIWARITDGNFKFRIYGANGALLESLTFAANDPAHPKGYYGFQRAGNDIGRFEIEGYYFGLRNFSTLVSSTAAVPEPAAWALMIVGFGATGAMMRRRRLVLAA